MAKTTTNAKATSKEEAAADAQAAATAKKADTKKVYAVTAKWEKRGAVVISGLGGVIALLGAGETGTVVAAPVGIPTAAVGGIISLVGLGIGQLGEEFSNWAADPPDSSFRRLAGLAIQAQHPLATGLPPKLTAALSA